MKTITRIILATSVLLGYTSAYAESVLTGFRIVYNLTEQTDQNNASSVVQIDVSESGVVQSIVPVVGTEYTFVLVEGDFFEVTHIANSASGTSFAERGSNRINSGFAYDAIVEDTGFLIDPLAAFAILLFGEADSDGIEATSQVSTNVLSFDGNLLDDQFYLARSATAATGLEDNLNFSPLGTFGDRVQITDDDVDWLISQFVERDLDGDGIPDELQPGTERLGIVNTVVETTSVNSTGFASSKIRVDVIPPIPLPGAVWLFGSAFMSLIGWSWRTRSDTASA